MRLYITAEKTSLGVCYKTIKNITNMAPIEYFMIIDMMEAELDRKIKIENTKIPKLPK